MFFLFGMTVVVTTLAATLGGLFYRDHDLATRPQVRSYVPFHGDEIAEVIAVDFSPGEVRRAA